MECLNTSSNVIFNQSPLFNYKLQFLSHRTYWMCPNRDLVDLNRPMDIGLLGVRSRGQAVEDFFQAYCIGKVLMFKSLFDFSATHVSLS